MLNLYESHGYPNKVEKVKTATIELEAYFFGVVMFGGRP